MSDFLYGLQDDMLKNGIDIIGSINLSSPKFQRFKDSNRRSKGKDIFIKILGDGEGASYGDWHDRSSWRTWWFKEFKDLNFVERDNRRAIVEEFNKALELERTYAMRRAEELIKSKYCGEPDFDHPYVRAKRIKPLYCGQIRSRLVIPIYNIHEQLQSLQFISKSGQKRFKKNTSYKEGFHLLGEQIRASHIIRICEGWATGCTIYEATGEPVIVAFNADNLPHVAALLRSKLMNCAFDICADNDSYNSRNTGIEAGRLAAKACGGILHYPDFSIVGHQSKPTDFNDLMCLAGIEEVERQLKITRK